MDPLDELRGELVERLRSRSPEVKEALVARGLDIEPVVNGDPEGLAGLRAAVSETVELIASVIEQGESWSPRLPPAVAALVRYLARNDVALDAVMRGYYGVTSVLFEFLTEEIAHLPEGALPYLVGVQSQHGDQLMSAVSAEYMSELERLDRSPAQRLAKRVQRLLAGQPVDSAELGYDLDAWHLGLVAVGATAEQAVRSLAERLGCQILLVPRNSETVWAWLGARRGVPFAELERLVSTTVDASVRLAVGEPRRGVDGWRLTHREAQTALGVMLHSSQRLVRGSDVVLPAAVLRDDAMRKSLIDTYLGPLDGRKDARVLRETLRAYFALDCNAASAAASLGVDRHTVQRRLRRVEEIIGRPLATCRTELEVALRVEELDEP